MAHELAGALQQAFRIRKRCAVKEPHVYVRSEYIDVAEGRISETCNRTAVMQELPNFVPAFSHRLKPSERDGVQFACMLFHPRIDGGIPLDSSVEPQEFRFHRRSTGIVAAPRSSPQRIPTIHHRPSTINPLGAAGDERSIINRDVSSASAIAGPSAKADL